MDSLKKSLELLHGHRFVDYKQLGLDYQLYSCEVKINFMIQFFHNFCCVFQFNYRYNLCFINDILMKPSDCHLLCAFCKTTKPICKLFLSNNVFKVDIFVDEGFCKFREY